MSAINLIVSKEAQEQINKLKADLSAIEAQILTISKQGLGKKLGFVDVSSQKELKVVLAENEKLTKQLDTANKQIVKSNEKINAVVNKEVSAYDALNKSQTEALATFNALQAKKATGNKLSVEEVALLKQTEAQLKKNQAAYKQIHGAQNAMGLSAKRTGVAFDSLGFSVAQLTRESPAFLNSVQTGFMALSNNIPTFVDEVDRLIKANRVLKDEGQKVVPVWKSVGKALFSMQSLISVVILLITLLGPKLFEMGKQWFEAGKKIDAVKESQEAVNAAMKKGTESAQKEIVQLKILSGAVRDETKSLKDRETILKQIRSEYGDDIKHLTDREILTNGLAAAEEDLATAILKRAKADAAASKISENMVKVLELEEKQALAIKKVMYNQQELDKLEAMSMSEKVKNARELEMRVSSLSSAQNELKDVSTQLGSLYVQNNKLTDMAIKNTDGVVDKKKESNKEDKTFLEVYAPGTIAFLERAIDYNEQLIKLAEDQATRDKLIEENKLWQMQIDKMNGVLELKYELEGKKFLQKGPEYKEAETESFNTTQWDNAERKLKDMRKELGMDIANIGFDAFNAMAEARIEAIDLEIEKLNERYEVQKALIDQEITDEATRNTALRQLDQQKLFDEKKLMKERKKEERKMFVAKQIQAVGEIAIEAAKGIAAANAQTAVTGGVSLGWIPLIIASAAAQTASVLAQAIPGFKDGHLAGTHSGLALTNDGGRIEVIQRRNGDLELSTKENRLINMNRGDKVHKSIGSFLDTIPEGTIGKYMNRASIAQKPSQAFDEHFKSKMIETMAKGLKGVRIVNNNAAVGDAVREAMRDSAYERKFL